MPKSLSNELYNPKPREVYCERCKEYTIDDRANPDCNICGNKLYKVIKSLTTGKNLTGNR